uniref:Transmembrane protein n=1 Tax=Medicago truncatula TaxID=3880 RepID=A2Q439_MEDTR|nr:hypothetical protein MtrDRAFT_AC155896g5v2 [Medicago truncatula]
MAISWKCATCGKWLFVLKFSIHVYPLHKFQFQCIFVGTFNGLQLVCFVYLMLAINHFTVGDSCIKFLQDRFISMLIQRVKFSMGKGSCFP